MHNKAFIIIVISTLLICNLMVQATEIELKNKLNFNESNDCLKLVNEYKAQGLCVTNIKARLTDAESKIK